MKQLRFCIPALLVALVFVSCDLKVAFTPNIQQVNPYVVRSVNGVKDTILLSDTVMVGDTLRMPLLLNGYYNFLTSFYASADAANVQLSLEYSADQESFLTAASDPEHAKLYFDAGKLNAFITTLVYIPVRDGTHRIDMVLASDAGEGYSPGQKYFYVAVK